MGTAGLLGLFALVLSIMMAVVILLTGVLRQDRLLRERLTTLKPQQAVEAVTVAMPSIRVTSPERSRRMARLFRLLRYNPEATAEKVVPWPLVALLAGAAAVGVMLRLPALLGVLPSVPLALLAALGVARSIFGWQQQRYREAVFQQIPDVLGLMVRAIRAGLPMAEAIRSISREVPSPTREEFARVVGDVAIGRPVDVAMMRLHDRTGLTEYSFLAVTLGLQSQTGGSLAETLDNLADMVRKRVAMAKRAKALAAEGRMQAGMLFVLPFIAAAGMSALHPGYLSTFTDDPTGQKMAAIGLAMMVLGLLTIRWMIKTGGPRLMLHTGGSIDLLLAVGVGSLALGLAVLAATLLAKAAEDRDLGSRMRGVLVPETAQTRVSRKGMGPVLLRPLSSIGEALRARAVVSEREVAEFQRALVAAGFSPRSAVPVFIGAKALLLLLAPAAAGLFIWVTGQDTLNAMMCFAGALALAVFLPNLLMSALRGPFQEKLRRGLPDALDLLVVAAEAGLGLDSAVDRVAREMAQSNRPLALELNTLVQEMRMLPDRRMALDRLGERTGLDGFRRVGATLSQTLRYGTPLAQALRVLAAELRQERMLRIEEKAVRLPAMLIGPLILFILPALFIVLVGPSILEMGKSLGTP